MYNRAFVQMWEYTMVTLASEHQKQDTIDTIYAKNRFPICAVNLFTLAIILYAILNSIVSAAYLQL